MLETQKANNSNIHKVLFVSLRPLYVAVMCYLEECSGSGCVIQFSHEVQW